jgi:signal recognition particle subunit SEC65
LIKAKAENCPVCGLKPSGPPVPLTRKLITELHSRFGRRVFRITPKEDLEINLDMLASIIKRAGLKIKVKAEMGITFENEFGGLTSILRSGISVVEGAKNAEEAYKSISKLIIDELGIPKSKIEF